MQQVVYDLINRSALKSRNGVTVGMATRTVRGLLLAIALVGVLLPVTCGFSAQEPVAQSAELTASVDETGDQVLVHRAGVEEPIVTQVARWNFVLFCIRSLLPMDREL